MYIPENKYDHLWHIGSIKVVINLCTVCPSATYAYTHMVPVWVQVEHLGIQFEPYFSWQICAGEKPTLECFLLAGEVLKYTTINVETWAHDSTTTFQAWPHSLLLTHVQSVFSMHRPRPYHILISNTSTFIKKIKEDPRKTTENHF